MATEAILRPDSKGRVGLGTCIRSLARQLGRMPSGFSAELTEDGAILLRPRIEVPADEAGTLLLSSVDRDRLLAAIDAAPAPNAALRKALHQHDEQVRSA